MIQTHSLPGRTVFADNQEFLWASGTAYLGMGHHAGFRHLLREGLARYGTTWGSSRHNTLRLAVYDEAEAALADFVGAPAALTVSSGMLAGQLAVQGFGVQRFFYAPGVHPALWGYHYQPSTETAADWWASLTQRVAEAPEREVVVATDSVGSPHTVAIPLEYLRQLPDHKRVTVLLDDSHGLGIFGEKGEGSYRLLRQCVGPAHRVVVVSSLNKALGTPAGAIFSDTPTIEYLRTQPFFGGSSPAAPAALWAMQHALGFYEEQHRILLENAAFFVEKLGASAIHFCSMPNYPAFTTTAPGLHEHLKEQGILTASFPYPTATDPVITRLVASSLHLRDDLEKVAECCLNFFQEKEGD